MVINAQSLKKKFLWFLTLNKDWNFFYKKCKDAICNWAKKYG